MIFNLQTYINMTKEAMAGKARRYRDETKWCSIEDAVKGTETALVYKDGSGVQTWEELKKEIPSTEGILYEILAFKAKTQARLMERYGDNKEEVDKYFQVLTGFHPMYGLYMTSVGPYIATVDAWQTMFKYCNDKGSQEITNELLDMAENDEALTVAQRNTAKQVKADKANKFSHFTKRYQRATEQEINSSVSKFVKKLAGRMAQYLPLADIDLNPSDFQIDAVQPNGEYSGEAKNLRKKHVIYKNLDRSSVSGQQLENEMPIIATATPMTLNAKGISKIMAMASKTGNWESVYDQAIAHVAHKNGIDFEKCKILMDNDINIMKSIVDVAKEIQLSLHDKKDPTVALMANIPDFVVNARFLVGTQNPSALRTEESQVNLQSLKVEILNAIVKLGENPLFTKSSTDEKARKVAVFMQESRKDSKYKNTKAKGEINPDDIKKFIEKIKQERAVMGKGGKIVGRKNYQKLLQEASGDLESLIKNKASKYEEGFDTYRAACIQAGYYHTSPRSDALKGVSYDNQETPVAGAPIEVSEKSLGGISDVDVKTKAKIGWIYSIPSGIFRSMSEDEEVSSKDLLQKRSASDDGLTTFEIIKRDENTIKKALSPIDMESQIKRDTTPHKTIEEQEAEAEAIPETPEDYAEVAIETVINENGQEVIKEEGEKKETEVGEGGEFPIEEVPAEQSVAQGLEPEGDFPIEEVPPVETPQAIQPVPAIQQPQIVPQEQQIEEQNPQVNEPQNNTNEKKRKKTKQNVNNLVANTLKSLIKIAKDLDDKGKYDAAEEVHRVIRKYQEGI